MNLVRREGSPWKEVWVIRERYWTEFLITQLSAVFLLSRDFPGFETWGLPCSLFFCFSSLFFFFYYTGCCSLWISICYGSCQPTWNYLIKDMYLFLFFKCLLGITFFYGRWWVLGEWWGKPWFCECL